MNRRDHRAALEAKRTEPDLGITEAEAREIRAISEHHDDEFCEWAKTAGASDIWPGLGEKCECIDSAA